MQNIPLLNIAALHNVDAHARQAVVADLGKAFHDVGFIAVQGHGVHADYISRLRQQVVALFDRPREELLAYQIEHDNYRGYIPLGFFSPNAGSGVADMYQAYKLHLEVDVNDPICAQCDLYGPNKWPLDAEHLKSAVLQYWIACERLTQLLLTAIAEYLGIDVSTFHHAMQQSLSNMTLLHYPATNVTEGHSGIHPHKDTDVLTILAPDSVGGLCLRPTGSGQWISADAPADALIINVGDMLEIWSGGYFISTPHKVVNNSGLPRYSFPYFAVPRFDVLVEPLINLPAANRRSMHAGDVSAKIWRSNWPDAEPVDACYDPSIK